MLARAAVAAFVTLIVSRTALAEDPPASAAPAAATPAPSPAAPRDFEAPSSGRELNGHVFMPSAFVPSALVTTSFASFLVLGIGQTSGTFQISPDITISRSFDYAGVGSILGYEYAFTPWLSARATLSNIIYSGINGASAIVVGTSLQFGGSVGATASLPVGDSLRLGVLFDAGITPGIGLTIGQGIRTIINSCRAGDCTTGQGEIFGIQHAKTLQPALAANWVPWRPLGVTAYASYLHFSDKEGDETVSADAANLAAAADLDLLLLWRVPIGLQVTVNWTAPINGEVLQHVTDVGGGLFYTGRRNLALGVQLVNRNFAVQPTVRRSWSTVIATVGLRYYW